MDEESIINQPNGFKRWEGLVCVYKEDIKEIKQIGKVEYTAERKDLQMKDGT